MVYQFKTPGFFNVDAQTAGEILEKIAQTKGLTPENVVEEARPVSSPIHNDFEWNDALAAEQYRQVQARTLIRNITVIAEENDEPTKAFVSINTREESREYLPIKTVLADDDYTEQMMKNAEIEWSHFRQKYSSVKKLRTRVEQMNSVWVQNAPTIHCPSVSPSIPPVPISPTGVSASL